MIDEQTVADDPRSLTRTQAQERVRELLVVEVQHITEIARLRGMLERCAEQFETYADLHRAAGKDEKAAVNQTLAERARSVLAEGGAGIPADPVPAVAPRKCRCGAAPIEATLQQHSRYRWMECLACGIRGDMAMSRAAAIAGWNRRAE